MCYCWHWEKCPTSEPIFTRYLWTDFLKILTRGKSLPTTCMYFCHWYLLVFGFLTCFMAFKYPPKWPMRSTPQLWTAKRVRGTPTSKMPSQSEKKTAPDSRKCLFGASVCWGWDSPSRRHCIIMLQAACCWLSLSWLQAWFVGVWPLLLQS